jgi:NitT/TauT family transport system substrate-binding protein
VVSRHSAFYSPLIATVAAGFLEREGFSASYRPMAPAERAQDLLAQEEADVIQSAVSSSWLLLERGENRRVCTSPRSINGTASFS